MCDFLIYLFGYFFLLFSHFHVVIGRFFLNRTWDTVSTRVEVIYRRGWMGYRRWDVMGWDDGLGRGMYVCMYDIVRL